MLKIRLQRIGKKNKAYFRVIVTEHTTKPKGKYLELLGSYDPHANNLKVKDERIKYWANKGAKISATLHNLLVSKKIIEGEKVAAWKPKPKKKEKKKKEKPEKKETETPESERESQETPEVAAETKPDEIKQEIELEKEVKEEVKQSGETEKGESIQPEKKDKTQKEEQNQSPPENLTG